MGYRPVLGSIAALAAICAVLPGFAQAQTQLTCRNVSQTITIDGKPQQAITPMCQQPDGSWQAAPAPAASNGQPMPQPYPPQVQAAYAAPGAYLYGGYDPVYGYYDDPWGYYSGGVYIGGGFHGGFHDGGGFHGGGGGFHGGGHR